MGPLKLLISVKNEKEALEAIQGGANIIDIENPSEGLFGAGHPRVIKKIAEITPDNIEICAQTGFIPNLSATVLAALGASVSLSASSSKVKSVKIVLFNVKTDENALNLIKEVSKTVKEYSPEVNIVILGFADFKKFNSIDPLKLPEIVNDVKKEVPGNYCVKIDVADKKSKSLFEFYDESTLKDFVDRAHKFGMEAGLAGLLAKEDVRKVFNTGADLLAVRKMVCSGYDRVNGEVQGKFVKEFAKEIGSCKNN